MLEVRTPRRALARFSRRACAALVLAVAAHVAQAQTPPPSPVLLVRPGSLRAVALDSVTLRAEPFSPSSPAPWMSADGRTRLMLFATNLAGAAPADLLVEAEDGAGRRHALAVEYVGLVPGLAPQNVSQIVVKLVDTLDNAGDVLLKITRHGAASNRARIGIGFVGGGPPDESIRITGRVTTANDAGLAGAILVLSGAAGGLTATDADGNYTFPNLVLGGDYAVTVSKINHAFAPPSRTVAGLLGVARADFVASLVGYRIAGRIEEGGRPLAGVTVNLSGSRAASVVTDAAGDYALTAPAEGNYLVTPELQFYRFSPASVAVHNLSADQTQNFTSTTAKPTFSVSGFVRKGANPLAGAVVTLSGSQSAITATDAAGFYAFAGLPSGVAYTVTASKDHHAFSPPSATFANLGENKQADFVASLVDYRIGGRVTVGGLALAGVRVNLSGPRSATATTDDAGNYSFTAPAESTYLVTPESATHAFSPSSFAVHNLSADQTRNFVATRLVFRFTVSGFVRDGAGFAVGGALVRLWGARELAATTNAAGFYSFNDLPEGGNYTVTASKAFHSVSPEAQVFVNITGNRSGDFVATSTQSVKISGRVTSSPDVGVADVTIMLSGARSATTLTDGAGNYSLPPVPAGNSYTITPSTQFGTFSPASHTLDDVSGDRAVNFTASAELFRVLEFSGAPQTVDYGEFFHPQPGQTQLGKFFWEFWAMPGTNAFSRYMLSDGYGGAHALLFGFTGGTGDGRYWLYGNVWNGQTAIQFGGDDGPAPNEWGHYAVGWDGEYILTYYNGVPSGLTPFSGPRMPAGSDNGGGKLFIGGSDHSNFMGRIAQVRGFEGVNPRGGELQSTTLRPDTVFGLAQGTRSTPASSFLTSFLRPALSVPDLAGGRVGVLRGTAFTAPDPTQSYPLPQYVIDLSAPTVSPTARPVAPAVLVDTPTSAPLHALIFDSFSRKNATLAFDGHGGLGSTESGSAGPKEWKTAVITGGILNDEAFGILNGRAVALLTRSGVGGLAWVEAGPSTGYLLVGSRRSPRVWKTGLDTGVVFRVADSHNFFFANTNGDPVDAGNRMLTVGYWLGGRRTVLVSRLRMPEAWAKLQVVTTGAGLIQVYADDTLVYTTTSDVLVNATGAGLHNDSETHALHNRWDNFTVYNRP